MKVYILTSYDHCEGIHQIEGVYATHELAEAAKKTVWCHDIYKIDLDIDEVEVVDQ